MSTVLTKPVLLDETGQAIVGKLDEIKDAIDNGGTEKYPVLIHITTMPTKTSYIAGEQLNLAGIVVKAVFSNNVEYDVTDQCTFSPANGTVLTSSDTSVTATYTWHPTQTSFTANQPISIKSLESIAVTTPPTQTEYYVGDVLDLSGIIVTATYDDETTEDVTSQCVYSPADGDEVSLDDEAITISYTAGGTTRTATQEISVNAIFGAEWDGTATTAWSRTDMADSFVDPVAALSNGDGSSPFDEYMPWKGMKRVEDPVAGTLVEIPKFYYKWTLSGDSIKLQISPKAVDGFYVSPAHSDRGDGQGERDVVYVGAYHSISTYKSATGSALNAQRKSEMRTGIHSLGSDIWQYDDFMFWTIAMLYLVEYADWNSQKVIGMGGNSVLTNGLTDAMIYHTGTDQATRSGGGAIRYRYIENLWSGVGDYIDGVVLSNNNIYMFTNPADYRDSISGSGYTAVASDKVQASGLIKKMKQSSKTGFEFLLYPATTDSTSSYTTYLCDYLYYYNSGTVQARGYSNASSSLSAYGLFYFDGGKTASQTSGLGTYGGRLQKLPNNT